jgi:NAD(P)-dependent dehydrogenase (short-subunit alcohol dehydrogenase family)
MTMMWSVENRDTYFWMRSNDLNLIIMKVLENKTTIITGAGPGIGKAMALLFASCGAKVLAADQREDRLAELEKEAHTQELSISTLKVNVGSEREVEKMIEVALERYGALNILVNNAGIMDDFMPVEELKTELWRNVMSVNIDGPFFSCRAAIPIMLKQGSGVIINISSIGGLCGARAGAAYTSSKHALIGLTKNIGFQYALKGIRCNAIAPGGVQTNIGENMHPNPFGYERLASGMQSNPRMGDANEIAEVALFLASEKSSFINGSIITADGGWTAY